MPLGSPALPGMHGLSFSIHHGPWVPPSQGVAGQPCCSVAHALPSSGLVQVARHSHSGGGGAGDGDDGDDGGDGSDGGDFGDDGNGGTQGPWCMLKARPCTPGTAGDPGGMGGSYNYDGDDTSQNNWMYCFPPPPAPPLSSPS